MKEAHKITLILPENMGLDLFNDIIRIGLDNSSDKYNFITEVGVETVPIKDFALKPIGGGVDSGILFEFERKK